MPDSHHDAAAAQPRTTRLADYRPPAFLVDQADLTFDLDETATHVASRLELRRNPAAADPAAPLHLDGDGLTLVRVVLNGEPLGANQYQLDAGNLIIPGLPDACTLEIETRINPAANTELSGLYVSRGSYFTQCEAEGFRRITFFPDRPDVMARYSTTIHADKTRVPVLLSNGNLVATGDLPDGRHFARWEDPHPKPAYLFALVAGDLVALKDRFTTRSGREVDAWHLGAARGRNRLRPRHGVVEKIHDLGRGSVRPGIRPRHLQHRRRVGLQHGGDGEQGAECLQHQIRAGAAGNGHRRRLPEHRSHHRARVFPQLDRQPRHLPRLVSVVAEGRPDGLSRPGILRRPGLARGEADRRCARPARGAVPRGCRAAGASGAARPVYRDQQFLYRDDLPEGRGGHPHDAHADRQAGVPPRHGSVFRPPRQPGGHDRRFRPGDAGCLRRGSVRLQALVSSGRHPGGSGFRCL